MLKKCYFLLILICFSSAIFAQNVQLHYVPRHAIQPDVMEHNLMLTTVEMFKPDKWGSTFMFIDMTYDGVKGGVNTAYWEIARDLKFWKCPIAAHIEYNGGVVQDVPGAIPNSYLVGASYPFALGKAFMSTYVAYKYNAFEKHSDDVQWTVTWNLNLFKNKLTMSGFMDLWSENKDKGDGRGTGDSGKEIVFLTQPQFWFNATEHFSLGSEVELSNNFYYTDDFYVFPTIAGKWTF